MKPTPNYLWTRWLYLRILAVGFLAGFLSLSTQIHGLIGPNGILPARDYLHIVSDHIPIYFRFFIAPSFLWLNSSSSGLNFLCALGIAASFLLLINIAPGLNVVICWFAYLSFVSAARNFSGFQSDGLMLESALLAFFLAPRGFRPKLGEHSPPSNLDAKQKTGHYWKRKLMAIMRRG